MDLREGEEGDVTDSPESEGLTTESSDNTCVTEERESLTETEAFVGDGKIEGKGTENRRRGGTGV